MLEAAFAGRNGLVFAYGVTNSGKTHTITGSTEAPGLLPRALTWVLKELARQKEDDSRRVMSIAASYLEIYLEKVFDLFATPTATNKRSALPICMSTDGVPVRGLIQRKIRTVKDAEDLVAMGQKNKQVAETRCNLNSSRSHTVFTLYLREDAIIADSATATIGKLRSKVSIVDLAGSERTSRTGAIGVQLREASKINSS